MGSEVGRDGTCAGGGDHGGLRLLEQPLNGFAVGLVAELPRELENSGGAGGRHADPAATAVNLGVPVLSGSSLGRWLHDGAVACTTLCGGAWWWWWLLLIIFFF